MKYICLNFRIHSPLQLVRYPFSCIGENHLYFDDGKNVKNLFETSYESVLTINKALLNLIQEHGGSFSISFSISGQTLELMEVYFPKLIKSFQQLAETGNVEFTSEPYTHSLACTISRHEFIRQVKKYETSIEQLFGQTPKTFRNTAMVYADFIGDFIADMGYRSVLIGGCQNQNSVNGKSPNNLYTCLHNETLLLLPRNREFSNGISSYVSNGENSQESVDAVSLISGIDRLAKDENLVNIGLDFTDLGTQNSSILRICHFLETLVLKSLDKGIRFISPHQTHCIPSAGKLSISSPTSKYGEGLSPWLANDMQQEAFYELYALESRIMSCMDRKIRKYWQYLQSSDHFYYMNLVHLNERNQSPYASPFEAYINYMNVLSDLKLILADACYKEKKSQPVKSSSEAILTY